MEKKDKVYYEKLYVEYLNNLNASKNAEEYNAALDGINDYKNAGLASTLNDEVSASDKLDYSTYQNAENSRAYNKFAKSNNKYINALLNNERNANDEIKRINRKFTFRKFGKVVVCGLLIGGLIYGVVSCRKNKKDSLPVTETSYTTLDTENTIGVTETETISTSDYGFSNDYDNGNAIPSMSDQMSGISINDPTTTQSNNNNSNGNTNNGGSTNATTTTAGTTSTTTTGTSTTTTTTVADPTTTTTTQPTTSTTTTTATQPTINDIGDTVPTTSYIEPSNTAPADDRNQRDVVIDDYDGVQPSYIDEDPTQTYPTYIDTTSTTTTYSTTVAPTSAPTSTPTVAPTSAPTVAPTSAPTSTPTSATYGNMPIDEDPDETYETFFEIPNKESAKKDDVKRLTLIRK